MKKGKTIRLQGLKKIKAIYGTVDSKNLKSIYLNIQTWVDPKIDMVEGWNRVISNFTKQIKQSVYEFLNRNFFEEKFILDLDLRSSGIQYGKKSFMNLEINLFLKQEIDFKSTKLKKSLKNIIKEIYSDVLTKNEYFKFYLTKNGNTKLIKVKTEKE